MAFELGALRDKKEAPRRALQGDRSKGQKDRLSVINTFDTTMFPRGKKIATPSLIRELRNDTTRITKMVLTGAE
jgi:hypothetical protein